VGKLVVFKLGDGSFEQGFPATLQIGEDSDRPFTEITGKLPPNPEICHYYSYWQSAYYRLGLRTRLEAAAVQVTNVSVMEDCYNAAGMLCQSLNAWLGSDSFRSIREKLLEKLMPSDAVRVILQTEDPLLQRLPWHLCNLFSRYPKAEIALSAPVYDQIPEKASPQRAKIRILAILGSSVGIDIGADRILLERLPDAEISFLVEPSRQQLDSQLWVTEGWDILFFAGHSASGANCEIGRIYINQTDSLTIADLKNALQTAVEKGLKLAIFNSCDGLGLARSLASLQISQVVLMREPVPDRVAQEFLKNFLQAFSGGKSLYLSVREARERLQGWENEFPCASWLPVIYQNPAEVPPNWQDWVNSDRSKNQRNLAHILRSSAVVTACIIGVRLLGMLQPMELQAYDHLMRLRPLEEPDPRLLVVTVTEQDFKLPEQKDRKGSLSDLALERLLQKLDKFKPRAIGLDIYRDFPVEDNTTNLATNLKQNQSLYALCKVSDPEFDPDGVQPPPEIPPDRLGFSDALADDDSNMVRRQLIHLDPPLTSRCSAKYAFSFKLARHYLHTRNIELDTTKGYIQFGNVVFKPLRSHAGAYQTLDTSRGYQVMLNYRPFQSLEDIAPQVTLEQILKDQIPPERVKELEGRIVLIGPTAQSVNDYWSTPYIIGQQPVNKQIPGVFVQAQMVSQILSTVLDGRPLIWVLPMWGEIIWICSWSIVGGLLVWRLRSPLHQGLGVGAALVILTGICLIMLTKGTWLPLVPSAMALVGTSGVVIFYVRSKSIALPQKNLAVVPFIAASNHQMK
jgi:CHASE2 domain-containing sensor protein